MEQDTDPLAAVVPVQVSEPFRVNVTEAPAIGPELSVSVPDTVAGSLKSLVAEDPSMAIAAQICIYTNDSLTIEEL